MDVVIRNSKGADGAVHGKMLACTLLTLWLLLLLPFNLAERMISCARYTRYHYINTDKYNLQHLDKFKEMTMRLISDHDITALTAMVVEKSIQESTHNLCEVKGVLPNKVEKRQAVIAGVVAGLALPALVSAIIHPTNSGLSPETKKFIQKTRSLTKKNSDLIYTLESRLNRVEAKAEATELLLSVLQMLHLEESKFRELVENNGRHSTVLYQMLKPVMSHYVKLKILNLTSGVKQSGSVIPLPPNSYHLNVTTQRGETCKDAKVEINLWAPLPSAECEPISQALKTHIITEMPNGDCRILPPLFTLLELNDSSNFSPFNYYIIPKCKLSNFTFNFDSSKNTLFAVPDLPGNIIASCGGLHRDELQEGVGVAPSLGCSSYMSSGHMPGVKDLFSPGSYIVNEQNEFLDAGKIAATTGSFSFLNEVDLSNDPKTTTTAPLEDTDDWNSDDVDIDADGNGTVVRNSMIVSLTGIFLTSASVLIYKVYKRCYTASYNPNSGTAGDGRRWTKRDIRIVRRSSEDLAQLASINEKLEAMRKKEDAVRTKVGATWDVELCPMPSITHLATLSASTEETSSFSSDEDKEDAIDKSYTPSILAPQHNL